MWHMAAVSGASAMPKAGQMQKTFSSVCAFSPEAIQVLYTKKTPTQSKSLDHSSTPKIGDNLLNFYH